MTTDKDELIQQARDSLAAAKLLLANGYAGYSAARSYYIMFYLFSTTQFFTLRDSQDRIIETETSAIWVGL